MGNPKFGPGMGIMIRVLSQQDSDVFWRTGCLEFEHPIKLFPEGRITQDPAAKMAE